MEDFYNAMIEYIDSKKPKEICRHVNTIEINGWRTCKHCFLCLNRVFHDDLYSNLRGYSVRKQKERFPKIRETMIEMIRSVTKQKSEIPPEIELCRTCLDHDINIIVIRVVFVPPCYGIRLNPRIHPPK